MAGGQYVWEDHKGWNTVCAGATCDWKPVYDTGDGHQVTALAVNGRTMYAAWCGPCNPGTGAPVRPRARHQLRRRVARAEHLPAAEPVHHLDRRRSGGSGHVYLSFGSYSRRWIPTAGYGHVFETKNGGATWANVSGNLPDAPVYSVAIRGGQLVVGTEVGVMIANRSSPRAGRASGRTYRT